MVAEGMRFLPSRSGIGPPRLRWRSDGGITWIGARGAVRGPRRLTLLVLGLGVAGAILLVAAELSTIASVELPGRTCREIADPATADRCSLSGFERHGGAFLLLGGLAALWPGAPPAAAAVPPRLP